ncbi:tetratricopeptide repeat protein [Streptomyces murinus]|uniref:tetratricopeptide repeat protein n=1 Tax=Streptomyces murinus TaxID=33900 RepID=UPI000A3B0D49|nr:tetratricopeptide repeat protein [Streptomyces murinus]
MTDSTHNRIGGGVFFAPVIQGRTVHLTLPDRRDPVLAGLPRQSSAFVGRETELDRIHAALNPASGDGAAGTVVVSGLAGMGKTELVLQAAHRALREPDWFPGGVLFADLHGHDKRGKGSVKRALTTLLRSIGVPAEHIPPSTDERAAVYRSALATLAAAGRRVLVVLDDVPAGDGVRHLLPGDKDTATLMSSRDTHGDLEALAMTLRQLPAAESGQLLTVAVHAALPGDHRTGKESDETRQLATLCGGLPLALRIIASLLVDIPGRPLSDLRKAMADAHSRLAALSRDERAVTAAFELSYRRLGKKQAQLFRLLCLSPGPDFSTECAAQLYGESIENTTRLLQDLARRNLVESQEPYGRWKQHSLVRLYSNERLRSSGDEWGTGLMRLFVHLHKTATDAVDILLLPEALRSSAKSRFSAPATAMHWLEAERQTLVAAVLWSHRVKDHPVCLALSIPTAQFLREAHYVEEASWTLKAGIRSSRKLRDRLYEASLLSAMGIVLRDMRKLRKSVRAHSKAVRICQDLKNRDALASALNNLGLSLHEQRRFDEAVAAHTEAEALYRRTGSLWAAAQALSNTGETLAAAGRPDDAARALRKALKIFQKQGDLRGYAQTLGSLAKVTRDKGEAEKAVDLHKQALDLNDGLLFPHERATELANFGASLALSDDFGAALAALREALATFRHMKDRRGEAMALGNMAMARQRQEKWRKAVALHTVATEAFLDSNDDHGLALELTSLARSLLMQGRNTEALKNFDLAARLYDSVSDIRSADETRVIAEQVRKRHAVVSRSVRHRA